MQTKIIIKNKQYRIYLIIYIIKFQVLSFISFIIYYILIFVIQ